jgi:nitroreductase
MIKSLVKRILPNSIIKVLINLKLIFSLLSQYIYDFSVYRRFNGAKINLNSSQIEGKIIAHYHVLEKGISHPTPKKCFSLLVVANLIKLINEYDELCPNRSHQVDVSVSVLKKYCSLPTNEGCISNDLKATIEALQAPDNSTPGTYQFTKLEFFKDAESSFRELALSRYSVRDFTEEDVSTDLLKEIVRIAQKTPSVCNRQTSKVHILTSKEDISNHLALQSGNRGFGHKINKLLIVTSDLYLFEGARERNQAFVDGGMFAMSLLYALHNLKVGAVTLNWAYDKKQDSALHALGVIPRNEKIILFIGVGYPPDTFKVAVSDRRELEEVVKIK